MLCFLPFAVSFSLDLLNVSHSVLVEFAEPTQGEPVAAIRGSAGGKLRFLGRCFIHTPEPDTCEAAAGRTDPAGASRWEHAGRTWSLLHGWEVHLAWRIVARRPVARGHAGGEDKRPGSCRWSITQLNCKSELQRSRIPCETPQEAEGQEGASVTSVSWKGRPGSIWLSAVEGSRVIQSTLMDQSLP